MNQKIRLKSIPVSDYPHVTIYRHTGQQLNPAVEKSILKYFCIIPKERKLTSRKHKHRTSIRIDGLTDSIVNTTSGDSFPTEIRQSQCSPGTY